MDEVIVENKKEKKPIFSDKTIRVMILITAWIFIILLLFSVIAIIKYGNMITTDPLNYGMKIHKFETCTCLDDMGKTWTSLNDTGFITEGIG